MDVEIEIAAGITDAEMLSTMFRAGVKESHFADEHCAECYGFALEYYRTYGKMKDAPTFDMLADEFEWYPKLVDGAGGGATAEYLADEVQNRHIVRSVESTLRTYLPKLKDEPREVSRIISNAIGSAVQFASQKSSTVEYGADLEAQEQMEREDDAMGSVPYPVQELTDRTGGMKDGELTVFAAKASGGKTWFACASALAAVKAGVDVYFATLEMPVHNMLQRIEFLDSGDISPMLYTQGMRTDKDILAMKETRRRIASYPGRLIVDQPPAGERTVQALVSRCKANRCKFIIVDQLQFVTRDSRYEKSYQALEKVMYDIKTEISAPADGVKLPMLLMHQFNREGVNSQGNGTLVGSMTNLAGSSVIEQVSDTVWGLGPSMDGTRGRKTLAVLKGRRFPEFGFQMVWETDNRARIEVDRDYNGAPVELEKW